MENGRIFFSFVAYWYFLSEKIKKKRSFTRCSWRERALKKERKKYHSHMYTPLKIYLYRKPLPNTEVCYQYCVQKVQSACFWWKNDQKDSHTTTKKYIKDIWIVIILHLPCNYRIPTRHNDTTWQNKNMSIASRPLFLIVGGCGLFSSALPVFLNLFLPFHAF